MILQRVLQDPDNDISDVAWFDIRELKREITLRGTMPPIDLGYEIWKKT